MNRQLTHYTTSTDSFRMADVVATGQGVFFLCADMLCKGYAMFVLYTYSIRCLAYIVIKKM